MDGYSSLSEEILSSVKEYIADESGWHVVFGNCFNYLAEVSFFGSTENRQHLICEPLLRFRFEVRPHHPLKVCLDLLWAYEGS